MPILGATGSGKSFLLNFLLTNAQKYDPLTFIFDLGGSYEHVARLFGGSYLPIGVERQAFTINPFCLPPTPDYLQFLFSFVAVLIQAGGYRMTYADEKDLFQQIESLYEVASEQRRLFHAGQHRQPQSPRAPAALGPRRPVRRALRQRRGHP